MSAESDIYTILTAAAGVAALVGDRIYPDEIPEKKPLPAIVFSRNGGEKFYGLDNSVHAERVRLRTVCWAETRTAADAGAQAIAAALLAAGWQPDEPDAALDGEVGNFAGIVETDWWSD